MRILQIALITQKGNVFNVKMQIDEIVFESKEEVREKLISVFANRKDAIVDVVIHSIQDELELSDYSNEQLKAELKRRSNIARMKAVREKPKYYYWEGTIVDILKRYNRFANWKFKIDSEELAASENFSYLNKWHGFEMISGAFNMTTAPKVGDRVKLRYRVVKSHFRSYRDSKIVSVIERADLS
ncbi:endonuclease [Bacteroides phage C3_41T2LP]|nr:endonuclease [Bacteroides phage C3_41T2LP]